MNLSIKKVQEIVETIYQPTFKVFTINSEDGVEFSKPLGYFVSLGITTSLSTLHDVCSFLSDQLKNQVEFCSLSELRTIKKYGQFLNSINKLVSFEDPVSPQYDTSLTPSEVLNKSDCEAELRALKDKMNESTDVNEIRIYSNSIGRLSNLIGKIDKRNEWNLKGVIYENDDYKIFHKKVNFIESHNESYRIGIFIKFI
jgi:hypothetical protein